jgi:ATP-binding cassette, subfamily B, bacterial
MNFQLKSSEERKNLVQAGKKFLPFLADETGGLFIAILAILINSGLNLWAPILIAHAVDTHIIRGNFHGVLVTGGWLLFIYTGAFVASFVQTRVMGGVAQRVLFSLRNAIFTKLQTLPVTFFNQNKAGDLISRINNDTDKLNQFFSQGIMQFIGNVFMILGAGVCVLIINPRLGSAALIPALSILIVTRLLSSWIKHRNAQSLQTTGGMSANIQESLSNFSVIIAFNRRDYFHKRFNEVNEVNYQASVKAGVANNIFTPIYAFASHIAMLIVLGYGMHLISLNVLTLGLLISYLTYVTRFYDPLKQMATIWSSLQLAIAAWDRISVILDMESNLIQEKNEVRTEAKNVLTFSNVSFHYPNGKTVLHHASFTLKKGKTYALIGPTGGGKTTIASLMTRLYDPNEGTIFLHGNDIRSYSAEERTRKIGFILQEPFLFSGTVQENIAYGKSELEKLTSKEMQKLLEETNLHTLLERFDKGLKTPVNAQGSSLSLGQRQLIAFIRAVLRKPDLLILDEATANIDTVTEQLLQTILEKLPSSTTRVIIAHRLNTIENADEIFFVNSGEITPAGSLSHAVELLMHNKRAS